MYCYAVGLAGNLSVGEPTQCNVAFRMADIRKLKGDRGWEKYRYETFFAAKINPREFPG